MPPIVFALRRLGCCNVALVCCLLLVASGCDSGPTKYDVSGQVSWQGQPVEQGYINFRDPAGQMTSVSAQINKGQYQAAIPAGTWKVEIVADREVGTRDPVMGTISRESYIPPEYNTNSTLEVTIEAAMTDLSFELPKK